MLTRQCHHILLSYLYSGTKSTHQKVWTKYSASLTKETMSCPKNVHLGPKAGCFPQYFGKSDFHPLASNFQRFCFYSNHHRSPDPKRFLSFGGLKNTEKNSDPFQQQPYCHKKSDHPILWQIETFDF